MNKVLLQDINEIINDKIVKEFYNKSVLVTGGTGLIGSVIIKCFLQCNRDFKSNIKIIALARNIEKAKDIFENDINDIKWIMGEINSKIEISEEIDYIIHTANPTVSKYFIENPVETIDSIVLGTKNILELAKAKKSNVVYLSSMEVYGNVGEKENRVSEDELGYIDNLDVRSSYPEGKRLAENMCKAYSKEYEVNVKIARLAQTFGAGAIKTDNRVFMQFIKSSMENRDIVLHTTGESIGNYCYLADCVKGIFYVLTKGKSGEAYNIVNEESTMSIKEMAYLVAEKVSNNSIKVVFDIPKENIYGYAKPTKLRLSGKKLRELGFAPSVSLLESYKRLRKDLENQC